MIVIEKEIQQDYYLIYLEDTKYLQIWNKWDLFYTLLDANKQITLTIDDTPISEEELNRLVENIKEFKQQKQQLDKQNGKQ